MKKKITPKQLYNHIRKLAKKNGMSISGYARSKGIDPAAVSRMQKGERNHVRFDTLYQLDAAELTDV